MQTTYQRFAKEKDQKTKYIRTQNNRIDYLESELDDYGLRCLFEYAQISIDEHTKLDDLLDDYNKENFSSFKEQTIDYLEEILCQLKNKDNELIQKDQELEDMMAMFAHKFRSPLDAIIYNTEHGANADLYIHYSRIMQGLLDIFSIISSDASVLSVKMEQDNAGESNPKLLLVRVLDMVLVHLLTVQSAGKIRQLYYNYALENNIITKDVSPRVWHDDYYKKEEQLQQQWQKEWIALIDGNNDLDKRQKWLKAHFFEFSTNGFDDKIKFDKYGITASLLTIIINEFLTNAFKYYNFNDDKKPLILNWQNTKDYQIISCSNPSTATERDKTKGSYKGFVFLNALSGKIDAKFDKPILQDDFKIKFAITNKLLK